MKLWVLLALQGDSDKVTLFHLYLFLICADGLSTLIKKAELRGDIHDTKICRNAPVISRLLFADDCADDCFLSFFGGYSMNVILCKVF